MNSVETENSSSTAQPAGNSQSLTVRTFWFAFAKAAAYVLSIGLPLLLVRLLDQREMGLYKQAFLLTTTGLRILTLGFGASAFYFFPRMRGGEAPIAANVLLFNFIAGAFAWLSLLAYPQLLALVVGTPELIPYAPLIGAVIFLWIFSSFLEIAPAAMQETRVSTFQIVGVQLSRSSFMIVAALWSASVGSLLWAAIAQGILQSLLLFWYLGSRFPNFWRRFSMPLLRTQVVYILPLCAAYIIGVLAIDAPQYLVAQHFSPAMYAIYAMGTFQLPIINVLHESVGMVLIPVISKLHHEGRSREIAAVTAAAMRKVAAVSLPAYLYFLIVAHEFIVVLYTEAYSESARIFAINITLLPLMVFIYDPLVRSFGETRRFLVGLRAILLVMLIIAVYAGVSQGSMTAAIYSVVAAAALERLIMCGKLARVLGLQWSDRRMFADIPKIGCCSLVAAAGTLAVHRLILSWPALLIVLVCAAVYGGIYLLAVVLMKIPTQPEYELAMRILRRVVPGRLLPTQV